MPKQTMKAAWQAIQKLFGLENEKDVKRCVITLDSKEAVTVEITKFVGVDTTREITQRYQLVAVDRNGDEIANSAGEPQLLAVEALKPILPPPYSFGYVDGTGVEYHYHDGVCKTHGVKAIGFHRPIVEVFKDSHQYLRQFEPSPELTITYGCGCKKTIPFQRTVLEGGKEASYSAPAPITYVDHDGVTQSLPQEEQETWRDRPSML